jgi:hypothetical protein
MAAREKLLDRMRRNPRGDWRLEDFQALALHFGLDKRSSGGSHVVFIAKTGEVLTVPARRPIKPIYVRMFVELIDRVRSVP